MNRLLTLIAICGFGFQMNAQVSFTLSASLGVGINVNSVVSADLNGDGNPDLISCNYASGTLSALTNDGSGGFVLAATLGVGSLPISVKAADVNGDGSLDLICANFGSSTLSVLTNNGSGGFVTAGTYAVGSNPWSVAVADVNGDGYQDLICANSVANTLSVLTNNGSGGFVTAGVYAVGSDPRSVAVADVNGDGKPDLISANYGGNTLSVLTNDGSSGFVTAGTYAVGNTPRGVVVADVDGDGNLDLISANNADSTISVLTNDGNGGFALAFSTGVGNGPQFITAADVNGDGEVDLITANVDNTLSVVTNATPFPPLSQPLITAQPTGKTNQVGATVALSVGATAATGPLLFGYQWRLAGTNLPAATNSVLSLPNLSLSQAGSYDVMIANSAGSVTSSPAILDVRFILIRVNGQPAAATITSVASAAVTISGGYPGGFLFYTLDGSTPTTSSTLYSGPITLTNSALVKAMSLSADFTQNAFASPVSVQIIPVYILQTSIIGNGTLSTNPPVGPYPSNSVVTLTANAASHWAFDHWTGDATGSLNPLNVTMNRPRNVQAVFVQTAYPLTISTAGGGGMTANGQVISPATYYPTGSVISIAATASNGWSFLGWQGDASGTNNPLSVTMNQTNNIKAVFGTVLATNSLGGSIVLSLANPIPYGTVMAVSALPDFGNYFVTWGGSVSGTNAPTKITVTNSNPVISALFSALPAGKYSLSVVVLGNGSVTNSPQRNYYNPGDSVTLKAITNAGTFFFGWTQDAAGTNNPLTVLMNTNKVILANFGVLPTVSISPLNLSVLAGSNAVLSASAFGLPPLAYQWQNNQGAIAGATNAILTFFNIQPTNAGNYSVVVTNSYGSVTSALATVTVIGVPSITNQPQPLTTVISGHTASFVVGASGWPSLAYQWRFNGANLAGATNTALMLQNAFPANAGVYTVAITNVYGSVTSNPAILTVLPLAITAPAILASGQFQFGFDTATGVNYAVQYSTNLMQWFPLVTVSGNGELLNLIDPGATGSKARFYRIILSPQ